MRAVKVTMPRLESGTMSYHHTGWRGIARLRASRDSRLPTLLALSRKSADPAAGTQRT